VVVSIVSLERMLKSSYDAEEMSAYCGGSKSRVDTDEMVLMREESTLNSCEGMRGINSFAMPGTSFTNELERTTEGGVAGRLFSFSSSSPLFFLSFEPSEEEELEEELLDDEDEEDFFDLLPLW